MWAFNSPPNYGVNTNPTQGELFVNDKIDRSDALVRERDILAAEIFQQHRT